MKKNIIYVDFVKKRRISYFSYLVNRFIYYLHDELKLRPKSPSFHQNKLSVKNLKSFADKIN